MTKQTSSTAISAGATQYATTNRISFSATKLTGTTVFNWQRSFQFVRTTLLSSFYEDLPLVVLLLLASTVVMNSRDSSLVLPGGVPVSSCTSEDPFRHFSVLSTGVHDKCLQLEHLFTPGFPDGRHLSSEVERVNYNKLFCCFVPVYETQSG